MKRSDKGAVRKHRSPNHAAFIDACRQVVLDEGYAAATSRRVAEQAGLKHQLLFYYFGSIDNLLLEVVRRGAQQYREAFTAAVEPARPLQSIWALIRNPESNRFLTEFLALGNHSEAIRAELVAFAESFRRLMIDALDAHLTDAARARIAPPIMSVLIAVLSRGLALETWLGIRTGLDDTDALIEQMLKQLDES